MPKFISLKQASKISGYNQDYLSCLIRQKKIRGEKIGRNWCTTEKDLNEYLDSRTEEEKPSKNFISKAIRRNLVIAGCVFIILLIIAIGAQLFIGVRQTVLAGDAPQTKILQTKTKSGVKVTSFTSDDDGEINISAQPIK